MSELGRAHLAEFDARNNIGISHGFRVDSGVAGPRLLISGGTHGNEPAGVEAAIMVAKAIEAEQLQLKRGSVDFIVGNSAAYGNGLRHLDSDLNRMFTSSNLNDGMPNTAEGQRAGEIVEHIEGMSNDGLAGIIDLHSVSVGDLKLLILNRDHRQNLEIANAMPPVFDYHFYFTRDHLNGILSDLGIHFKVDGYSIECGGHSSPLAVLRALWVIRDAIDRFGLGYIGEFPEDEKSKEIMVSKVQMPKYETISKIVPTDGFRFLTDDVKTGTPVKSGEVFAVADGVEHIAPEDGYIVMPDKSPRAGCTDAGFLCKEV